MLDEQSLISRLIERAVEAKEYDWAAKLRETAPERIHVAVMVEPYLSLILQGKKTVESRFSRRQITPWQRVRPGDIVVMKKSGGSFVGMFEAADVLYEKLDNGIDSIRQRYQSALCVGDAFWQSKADSRYATLIIITRMAQFRPFALPFKNRQAWIDFHGPIAENSPPSH